MTSRMFQFYCSILSLNGNGTKLNSVAASHREIPARLR